MLSARAPLIREMIKIHQFAIMCAPTTSQLAAVEALRSCDEEIEAMRDEYDMRGKYLVGELNRIGLECFQPRVLSMCSRPSGAPA